MPEINIEQNIPQINIDTATRTYHLPIASSTTLGGIKVGNNLTIETDGTLNAESTEYNLPVATSSTLGGVKIGNGLTINNEILSANVDSQLSNSSTNPVRNSVVTTNINNLTSSIQTVSGDLSALNTTVGNLQTAVGNNTSDITTLSTTVSGHTSTLSTLSDTVDDNSSSISSLNNTTSDLDDRLDTVESTVSGNTSDIADLKELVDDEQTYSYLLPVSTWTAGSITLERRGKTGVLYINIEGDLTISSGSSSIIYNFTDLSLYLPASAVLMTDNGAILGKVNDQTGNLVFDNITSQSIHINKVQGSIPLIFV